jgi:PhzF family phenazine biosynthesis protein
LFFDNKYKCTVEILITFAKTIFAAKNFKREGKMKFWQVDAFTKEFFKGNPAAVFILENSLSPELMQQLAMEMNLSETVFVETATKSIRWFTPKAEVDLCGHATLAAAHIMFSENFCFSNKIELNSRSGALSVTKLDKGYELDFPSQPSKENPQIFSELSDIMQQEILYCGTNCENHMAILKDAKSVRALMPDMAKIKALCPHGLLVAAADESGEYDYIYRTFFPSVGIDEDPVTGSANTCLAPYFANKLKKSHLRAFQASSRGGELLLNVCNERILISGSAVTIFTATLNSKIL